MRKGLVAVIAVALIGILGIYSNGHKSNANSLVQGANTSANTSQVSANTTPSLPASANSSSSSGTYKDGSFTGQAEDTPYGTVQISVVISGGKIVTVNLLQMPNDRGHTQEVTAIAGPLLKQTTLQKQSANIDFISGATSTSEGYQMSLQSALDQAV